MLDIEAAAEELATLFGAGRSASLLTASYPKLDLPTAYQIAEAVRVKRLRRDGTSVGRKIGFTNHHMWERYRVKAPIWGYMYESTVREIVEDGGVSLAGFPEPKIEPEIVFGVGTTPRPGMDEAALLGCLDWVALGFELVSSIYAGWQFEAADAVAAYGVHFALRIGDRIPIDQADDWLARLSTFRVDLFRNGEFVAAGGGADVLGSPLGALRHLNDLLADPALGPPLAAGEIVTTGTLTLAMAALPGETWRVEPQDIGLRPISIRLS
jgi:2-oxo-3-hexenedioate decarboxylase